MKYYKFVAVIACALLIVSCFLPWAFYPDRNEVFTGFYSYQNLFGKRGRLSFASLFDICFIDRMWAKR